MRNNPDNFYELQRIKRHLIRIAILICWIVSSIRPPAIRAQPTEPGNSADMSGSGCVLPNKMVAASGLNPGRVGRWRPFLPVKAVRRSA